MPSHLRVDREDFVTEVLDDRVRGTGFGSARVVHTGIVACHRLHRFWMGLDREGTVEFF